MLEQVLFSCKYFQILLIILLITTTSMTKSDLEQTIKEIFYVTDGGDVLRFNPSASQNTGKASVEQTDFVVRRNADGKLNIVYNTTLSLQNKPFQQTTTKTTYSKQTVPTNFRTSTRVPSHIKCQDGNGVDKTFCTKVANYPVIPNIETQLSKFSSFFGEDSPAIEIIQRMDGPQGKYLCDSKPKTIYPEAGETKNASWLFIVNRGDFKQGIRIEECENENATCNFMEALPNTYVAKCKQHYIWRRLVAVTESGTTVQDEFRMPSCCKCVVTQL